MKAHHMFCIMLLSSMTFAAALFAVPSFSNHCHQVRRQRIPQLMFGLNDSSFDYSSPRGWDAYYRQESFSNETLEWHSSIPFSVQIGLVPRGSSCLILGCGNSAFPTALFEAHHGETVITCLDSSSACIDQLRHRYSETCSNMVFVCGDAIDLAETLAQKHDDASVPLHYDVIMDKGLTDAILCGEGWDGPLKRLLTEASNVLASGGTYVMICYRLSNATRLFLNDVGTEVGLSWSFNTNGSTDRVSVSIATKNT